jgi:uncharacterized protein DUF4157
MSAKSKTTDKAKGSGNQRAQLADDLRSIEIEQEVHPATALQRAHVLPASELSASDILALQRTIGNRAVQQLLSSQIHAPLASATTPRPVIQAKLMVGPAANHYEQEADRIARKVAGEHAAESGAEPIQRQTDEEEPVQRKPVADSITPLVQRQPETEEDEKIQTSRAGRGEGFEANGELENRLQASRGNGSPLPGSLRSRMERSLGSDFGSVRIHTGDESDRLNLSLQSYAFTTGHDLFFKRGEYNPESQEGRELIAHELVHVMQQKGSKTGNKIGASSGEAATIQRLTEEEKKERNRLKKERREAEKQTANKPEEEKKADKKEDKQSQEASQENRIKDMREKMKAALEIVKTELKKEAEDKGLVWTWANAIDKRYDHLDDNWFKTMSNKKIKDKPGEIKDDISKEIKKAKKEAEAKERDDGREAAAKTMETNEGLNKINKDTLLAKGKTNDWTVDVFRDKAEAANLKQGKLKKQEWMNTLSFPYWDEMEILSPLKKGDKSFETHLRVDKDTSFKDPEPQYKADEKETKQTIMDKLLKVDETYQIHVTVRTEVTNNRGAEKNPHLFWFATEPVLTYGNRDLLRYDDQIFAAGDFKPHMTAELKKVKDRKLAVIGEKIRNHKTAE